MEFVDFRRLELLVALARLGSMRAVAEACGLTTSTVSQQLAALTRDVGVAVIERDGRRVRLTPAGQQLVGHAVDILAAVEAARQGLSPSAEPAGTLRVGGFTAGIRVSLLPILRDLAASTSAVELIVNEYAPDQSLKLLLEDQIDLALTYDYELSPGTLPASLESIPIWSTVWGLGVPGGGLENQADLRAFADQLWIVNSGSTADENVVRVLASIFGFTPIIGHRVENLELVEDFVIAGQGVALLPMTRPTRDGVRMLAITDPVVTFTAYAVWRKGRGGWPPLRFVLDRLLPAQTLVPSLSHWPRRA